LEKSHNDKQNKLPCNNFRLEEVIHDGTMELVDSRSNKSKPAITIFQLFLVVGLSNRLNFQRRTIPLLGQVEEKWQHKKKN
jgi:hypothetical protein